MMAGWAFFSPKLWHMFTAKIIKHHSNIQHGKQEFWKRKFNWFRTFRFSMFQVPWNRQLVAESLLKLNKNHPMTPIPQSYLVTVAQWDVCKPSPIHWVLQRDGSVPTNSSPARRSWCTIRWISLEFCHLKLESSREPRIKPKNQPTPPLLLSVVALGLGAWVSHPKCQSQAAWIPFRTQLNPPTNIHLHYPTSIHLTCANSQTGFMDMQSLVSNKTYIIGNLASLTMYSNYFEYTFFMVNKWLQYL